MARVDILFLEMSSASRVSSHIITAGNWRKSFAYDGPIEKDLPLSSTIRHCLLMRSIKLEFIEERIIILEDDGRNMVYTSGMTVLHLEEMIDLVGCE